MLATKLLQCPGCELFQAKRIPHIGGQKAPILIFGDYPSDEVQGGCPFEDRAGMIVKHALNQLRANYLVAKDGLQRWNKLDVYQGYAVQCCSNVEPKKEVIARCRAYTTEAINTRRPKVVITLGAMATKSILRRPVKFDEVRGTLIQMTLPESNFTFQVLPTFSPKAILAQPGLYDELCRDLRLAFLFAENRHQEARLTEAELRQTYRFPHTVEEVRKLCQEIIDYAPEGCPPERHLIAVDTETNTLEMHDPDAKIIAISFAWGNKLATTILLDHPRAPWTPEESEQVKHQVRRVLASEKPKVLHNHKFDCQGIVHRYGWPLENVVWDTMGAEHLLEEDKKGAYGLKVLTRYRLPAYAGYEDQVAEQRDAHGGLTRAQEGKRLRKAEMKFEDATRNHAARVVEFDRQFKLYQQELAVWEEGRAAEKIRAKHARRKMDKEVVGKKPKKPLYPKPPKKPEAHEAFDYTKIPVDQLEFYAAVDVDVTRQHVQHQHLRFREEYAKDTKMRANANAPAVLPTRNLVKTHVIPTSNTLAEMEFTGIPVDMDYLNDLDAKLEQVVINLEKELYDLAGGPWTIGNPQEITRMLFHKGFYENKEKVVVPLDDNIKRTAKGQISANEKALLYVANTYNFEFPKKIIQLRKALRARTPFLTNIREHAKYDGRMHSQFHLTGTGTGRLASSDENLQNISGNLGGYNIKKIFIPPPGMTFINADAKGAEIRIFAAYSMDEALIEALNNGLDSHSFFTSKVYGYPYEEIEAARAVDKKDRTNRQKMLDSARSNCKRVVFGTLYGAMAGKIAETAGISMKDAQDIIDLMFEMFPSIPAYIQRTHLEVEGFGGVYNKLGRKRRFPLARMGSYRSRCYRQAVNFKIQSTSSDIVLWTLNQLAPVIKNDLGGQLHLTVHDSIGFSVPHKYVSQVKDLVYEYGTKRTKEVFPWLPVPFLWDVEAGRSYGELQHIDQYVEGLKAHDITEEAVITDEEIREALDEYLESTTAG